MKIIIKDFYKEKKELLEFIEYSESFSGDIISLLQHKYFIGNIGCKFLYKLVWNINNLNLKRVNMSKTSCNAIVEFLNNDLLTLKQNILFFNQFKELIDKQNDKIEFIYKEGEIGLFNEKNTFWGDLRVCLLSFPNINNVTFKSKSQANLKDCNFNNSHSNFIASIFYSLENLTILNLSCNNEY